MKAVVVGGGLAGLAAALDLADAGQEVTVFEARPTLGGAVQTHPALPKNSSAPRFSVKTKRSNVPKKTRASGTRRGSGRRARSGASRSRFR